MRIATVLQEFQIESHYCPSDHYIRVQLSEPVQKPPDQRCFISNTLKVLKFRLTHFTEHKDFVLTHSMDRDTEQGVAADGSLYVQRHDPQTYVATTRRHPGVDEFDKAVFLRGNPCYL